VVVWIAAMVIGSPMLFVQQLEVLLRNIIFFSIPFHYLLIQHPSQLVTLVSVQALYVAYCDLCGCITITDLRISPGFSFY